VDPNLAGTALVVVGEDADKALWDDVRARLAKTEEAELRGDLIALLSSARRPELALRARELALDPQLRGFEATQPIWTQLQNPEARAATWQWVKDNFEKLSGVIPKEQGARAQLIQMASLFCDEDRAKEAEAFFTPARIAKLEGGPRVLAGALEDIRLCAAKRKLQEPSARELFGKAPVSKVVAKTK
jgi:alanyl aminopeptidase